MHEVRFPKRPNVELLEQQLEARGLPGYAGLSWDGVELVVRFQAEPTSSQRAELDQVVAAHDPEDKTEAQQAAEDAQALDATERATIATVLAKADADVTAGEAKQIVLTFLRRWQRQGRL